MNIPSINEDSINCNQPGIECKIVSNKIDL